MLKFRLTPASTMKKSFQIPRRTFLRGLGTIMALPMLEAMAPPIQLLAADSPYNSKFPKRMAFVYIPNGANMVDWTPKEVGTTYQMPYILEPMEKYRSDIQVLSGLAHLKARANGDGAGDHARASATFLTGCQARKTAAIDVRVGISVDQVAAARVGRLTRLPSLELSCDAVRLSGNCDSGYSCAYQHNISWKSDTTPMPPETNPRLVFERLFGSASEKETAESKARRERYKKSILDFVMDDADQLKKNLGTTDQQKLEEYLSAVRDLEVRIEQNEKFSSIQPDFDRPTGIPKDYTAYIRLMYDLLALSFQTDATRISTFITAHDGSNKKYDMLGLSDGHHDLSHHQGNEEKKKKIAKINRFHMEQFAYFLGKLKNVKEGNGTLLDNSMIVIGSGIADGNAHAHHDLPILLAGKGGGTLKAGRHVRVDEKTPMTNLYLSLLDRLNAPAARLGDSTGKLSLI
ncbi:MAG: hypothetical protein JWN25_2860 [Verrucomicrobiales bacterium]|nr:hypothetical protein [Verrucomicrobiales bacterium]